MLRLVYVYPGLVRLACPELWFTVAWLSAVAVESGNSEKGWVGGVGGSRGQ